MLASIHSYFSKLFSGDLSAFGGRSLEETIAGRIRVEQLTLVLRQTPGMMLANACNALVLATVLWKSHDAIFAGIWAFVVIASSALVGLKARAARRITKPLFVSRRTTQRLVRNAFILGSMWAVVPTCFFANATHGGQLVIMCLCAGMLAGGAFAFATIPAAAIAVVIPILLGTAIRLGQGDDFAYMLIVALAIVYAGALLRAVFAHSFEFTERLIAQLEAEKVVRQDALTHLPNRLAFNEGLQEALARLERLGETFAVLMLDLDGFKAVNDQFGHPAGDDFLIQVGARLRRCTREVDTVARIGGDEFAVMAANVKKPAEVLEIAERFVAAFGDPFHIEGREIASSTSIGIALAPRDGSSPTDLLKHVDIALYRAKKEGSGQVRFFEPGDNASARERKALQADLEKAIEHNQLFLVYQPFHDLRENRVTGFEALLRWRHPTRGLISPIEFIGIAEETGLIHAIGEWVVRRACETLSRWPEEIRIAVNFSAVQFQRAQVLQDVVQALADARVSPARLEIEITESTSLSKGGLAESLLKSLTQLGVTIALDDFGTGFSSLTYLRKLPFSRIKIDQTFVREMLSQADAAAIVRSVISLAQDLRLEVVAEGVETKEQLDYLRQTSCSEVQGYFIGRPMSEDETCNLLAGSKHSTAHAA